MIPDSDDVASPPAGAPVRAQLDFEDPEALRELVGELGGHLRILGNTIGVDVSQRGGQITVVGGPEPVGFATDVLHQLFGLARAGFPLHGTDIDQACRILREEPELSLLELYQDTVPIGVGRRRVHPRSVRQRAYLHAIRGNDLVFGIGPAGTGKTYLAMAMAVAALLRDEVERIILCRPAVEAGEKLGFLPGDMVEKVNPYLRPLYDAMHDLIGAERAARLIERGAIEVAPLAFMRGRTLSKAFCILDEAQNTTVEQMKMFLTRIGVGSRAVVTGDITQIDLPMGRRSGLVDALHVLHDVDGISVVRFTDTDVVRHTLVAAIVRAYERARA